jgi:hypothetical protein
MEIKYTHSDCHWGFTRGITMGFIRGITLDDHPLSLPESLLTGAARGSGGIPDSLGHKPVDTSGRAAWPTCRPVGAAGGVFILSHLIVFVSLLVVY